MAVDSDQLLKKDAEASKNDLMRLVPYFPSVLRGGFGEIESKFLIII